MSPVARSTDPETSWEAAESVQHIRLRQRVVLEVLRTCGPMTDEELVCEYDIRHFIEPDVYPAQAESGLRTRRSELVDKGLAKWSGQYKKMISGRRGRMWEANPP